MVFLGLAFFKIGAFCIMKTVAFFQCFKMPSELKEALVHKMQFVHLEKTSTFSRWALSEIDGIELWSSC